MEVSPKPTMEKKNQKPEKALKLVEEGEVCEALAAKVKPVEGERNEGQENENKKLEGHRDEGDEVAVLKEGEKTFPKIRSDDSLAKVVARDDLELEEFEDGWGRSTAHKKPSWIWLSGLFVGVVLIGGLVIWAVFFLSRGADNFRQTEEKAIAVELEREQLREDSQEAIAEIKAVTRKFLAAKNIEELKSYIDMPERVSLLVDKYYQKHEWRSQEVTVKQLQPITVGLSPYWMVHFSGGLENRLLLMAEKEDGYKVDWESFVCYNPMTLKELIEYQSEIVEPFRVYARIDNLYSYDLTEEEYQCFRLTTIGEETHVWGYLKKGTDVWAKLHRAASRDPGLFSELGRPMMLKVARPVHKSRDNYFIIKDFISSNWVHPRDRAF